MNKSVSDQMTTNIITVKETETLNRAYELMKKSGLRHLPVFNYQDKIVGVISDRNFQRAIKSEMFRATRFDPKEIVADYMSTEVFFVNSQEDLSHVIKIMLEQKISSVLIAEGTQLVGILTTDDILRLFLNVLEESQKLPNSSNLVWSYLKPINEIASQLSNIGI